MEGVLQILDICNGITKAKVTHVLTRLGLFDTLREGKTMSAAELASALKVDKVMLYRLLRHASQIGLVKEQKEGYSVTAAGVVLAKDHPTNLWALVTILGMNVHAKSFDALYEGISQGRQPLAVAFNVTEGRVLPWDIIKKDPAEEQAYMHTMKSLTHAGIATVMAYKDWNKYESIADVGGATGTVVRKVLAEYASIKRGLNVDQDYVIAECPPPEPGLEGRLVNVAADFFKPLPKEMHGMDAIVMKHIMHDFNDKDAVAILKNCIPCLAPGGHILIIDHLIPDTTDVPPGTLPLWPFSLDIIMMAVTDGGCERTMAEWKQLCAAAGLSAPEVVATHDALAMLRCVPV